MTLPMPEYPQPDREHDRRVLLDVLAPLGAKDIQFDEHYGALVLFYAGYEKNKFLFDEPFWINGYCLSGDFPPLPTFREDVKRHPIVAAFSVLMFVILFVFFGWTMWMSSVVFTLNQVLCILAVFAVMGLFMFGVAWWTSKGQREQRLDYRRMS